MEKSVSYRGVRKRKWGKWVSEIREPGKKTRIWLGSFQSPEMAAAAYDVACYKLRGKEGMLNFPELVNEFPRPRSEEAEEIRVAAVEAAGMVGKWPEMVRRGSGSLPALKRLSQGLGSEELGLDSPKMWAELAEALLLAPPAVEVADFEDVEYDQCLWAWGS
ncbi:AP2/ERF domain-containing protein [Dioscorea alata]|uniref:AP2/ERF domain-containing protein n=1 Tax=Dioscorea alata TaxID=55571 RepID=A0ACB7W1Q7_DIOAL|nr:AP2/ERF domain-containing protein [Dioscorea alata]